MEQGNLLCETLDCGKPAVVFGIKESLKIRSCEEHVASLISKKLQICDIMSYSFISNLHDAAEYEERKTLVDKGRGNITVLEVNCESELSAALQAIDNQKSHVMESVERRFEEVKATVTETCNGIKLQFAELQRNLAQFLDTKENQLSPTAKVVCGKLSIMPLFLRFGISDISSRISAELSTSWAVSSADIHSTLKCLDATQKKATVDSALAEAAEYAKKGIHNALCYVDLLTGEEEFGQPQVQVLTELLKFEKARIEENLKWLQVSWDLRQRCELSGSAATKVGQALAALLSHQLGQFPSAERILRLCHEIAQGATPQSEDSMSLCADLCGVYVANAQFQQAEELSLWALQTFAAAGLPPEYYWTVLFYLIDSMRQQGKQEQTIAILEYWGNMEAGNKLSEMLRLLIYGSGVYQTEGGEEAKWLLQARRIGISHFPTSTFTAFAFFRLALASNSPAREELHKHARAIYEVSGPKTFYAALNLSNLGDIFLRKDQFEAAEECYLQAKSIYENAAPKSMSAATNLCSMAAALEGKARWNDAIDCRQQAWCIYEFAARGSFDAAVNLMKMGVSLGKKGRCDEAMVCHQQARSIFEFVFPQSAEAANNLSKLAGQLENKEKLGEAEECFKQARSIYEMAAPKSIGAASNLNNMGLFYYNRKRWEEAEECYRQSRSIYEAAAPKSFDSVINIRNIGALHKAREQWNQAEKFFKLAQSIYEEIGPKSAGAGIVHYNLGVVYKAMGQNAQALECLLKSEPILAENSYNTMKSEAEGLIAQLKKIVK